MQTPELEGATGDLVQALNEKVEGLEEALVSRDVIGQAKGILMERHKLTGDQAFALLVRASQRTNTRLADIAAYLAETGDLRTSPDGAGNGRDLPAGICVSDQRQRLGIGLLSAHRHDHRAVTDVEVEVARADHLARDLDIREER